MSMKADKSAETGPSLASQAYSIAFARGRLSGLEEAAQYLENHYHEDFHPKPSLMAASIRAIAQQGQPTTAKNIALSMWKAPSAAEIGEWEPFLSHREECEVEEIGECGPAGSEEK